MRASSIMCPPGRHLLSSAVAAIFLVGSLAACATSEESRQKSKGYYQEGLASLETDRQRAFVSFQKAVQANPDNKEAHYGLGHILVLQGKPVEAEPHFRAAIRIDDNYSEAHTYLGQVLVAQDRWSEAIPSFRKALSNPLYATPDVARFHLGRALEHEGDLQGAMESLEDALAVNPPNVPPAMLNLELGRVYSKMGFDRRAKETLAKVIAIDKNGEYGAAAKEILARSKP